jgi:hypothetical protein
MRAGGGGQQDERECALESITTALHDCSLEIDKTLDEPAQAETDRNAAQMGFKSVFDGRPRGEDADGDESAGDGHVTDEAFGMR